jgi:two-component system, OmpR family, sensor histidine kinase CpxA
LQEKLKSVLLRIRTRVPVLPLFVRIFFWFLIASRGLLFLIDLGRYLPGPRVVSPPNMYATVVPVLAAEAVNIYESGGPAAFERFTRDGGAGQQGQIFLLDGFNRDVLSRPVSRDELEASSEAKTDQLVVMHGQVAVYKYISPTGRPYVFVLNINKPGMMGVRDLLDVFVGTSHCQFKFTVLLAMVLFCATLAYHISAPIRKIQQAAKRVAEGDLTTRVSGSVLRRHDELSALARDFDRMVARLDVLVRTQKNLLNSVSHELRSPLTRINLCFALLEKPSSREDEELYQRIEREIAGIDQLVGQLLTLARLEGKPAGETRGPVDLTQLLEEITADGNFEAQASGKIVSFLPGRSAIVKDADPLALRSAIENIVRNGVRFTQPGTGVRVSLEFGRSSTGPIASVFICDSGPGVPDQDLEAIFQPFFRVSGKDETSIGNGLGLAIASEAIRLHGGIVTARNLRPSGLEVRVQLPVDPEAMTQELPAEERVHVLGG